MEETTQVMTKRRLPLWLRIICIALAVILLAAIVLFGIAGITWRNEIATISGFERIIERNDAHLDGAVYRMEVEGGYYFDDFLAEGGASSDSELIDFITGRITRGLVDMTIQESEIGCSSFTAVTEGGDRLFARNYDFSKTNTALVFTDPGQGRHKSVSTVDLQFLGMDVNSDVTSLMDKISCLAAPYAPLDGINDAGVSCGIYMTYQGGSDVVPTDQQTEKPDITSTTMLRMVLDYASTAEEAVALIQQYDLHDSAQTSYHYMIADATGRSAILEWTNGNSATDTDGSARTLKVIWNDDDAHIGEEEGAADYQWITNFVLQPGYYSVDSEKRGLDRYDRIYECLSATDGVVADEEAAMAILQEVGRRSWNNDDGNGCTVHSVVYNLTQKTVYWVANEHYGEEYATLRFDL